VIDWTKGSKNPLAWEAPRALRSTRLRFDRDFQ
jgi:hypothetical protein